MGGEQKQKDYYFAAEEPNLGSTEIRIYHKTFVKRTWIDLLNNSTIDRIENCDRRQGKGKEDV